MGIEFLGNKRQLEDFLMDNLAPYISNGKVFFDLFCGSGSVSLMIKKRGMNVIANDFMYFSSIMTKAVLENNCEPQFSRLKKLLGLGQEDPYGQIINFLNSIDGEEGFIYSHYSPASRNLDKVERMYFTEENARKIDAIRKQITIWDKELLPEERALLISDLLDAVSDVSNIAGTYGCYMKYWKEKALGELTLCKRKIVMPMKEQHFLTLNKNANDVIGDYDVDIIYIDPPYTKRQYSAYYHMLETIALNDYPAISGKTGLRNWQQKSSDYCYKRKAGKALEDLLKKAKGRYFIMSYNNEGQINHSDILSIMNGYGKVIFYETPYKRYKSNSLSTSANEVIERLYILELRR
ncbi:MAG: DNA adenine methylase [Blautia sp.]|nr:DNA adenine methylase [Blautia sp.]MCM1201855.1 DNA adenine methylase [Bacteroides fragilis]